MEWGDQEGEEMVVAAVAIAEGIVDPDYRILEDTPHGQRVGAARRDLRLHQRQHAQLGGGPLLKLCAEHLRTREIFREIVRRDARRHLHHSGPELGPNPGPLGLWEAEFIIKLYAQLVGALRVTAEAHDAFAR